jgi:hypothetical protein
MFPDVNGEAALPKDRDSRQEAAEQVHRRLPFRLAPGAEVLAQPFQLRLSLDLYDA